MIRLMKRSATFAVITVFLWSAGALAQTTTGSILGDVTDTTGGKLPGVTVTAVNQANGASRTVVTDAVGAYQFSALPPGTYTIKAELQGFQAVTRKDVQLPIASQVRVPFKMGLANVSESITVTEQAPLVDTTEQVVKTVIDQQQIKDLPLKTRDFMDLTMLAPGVVTDQGSAARGQTDSISFGGMSEQYKSVWLDGVDFNDEVTGGGSSLSSATRLALASEAIQEFQVMSNSYSAEYGRSASGAVNIVTKSGGNQVHGDGFYFRRDDAFEKPNYFSQTVPPFQIEQYGATVGGPVKENRLFYFGSWERRADTRSVQVNIPVSILDFVKSLGYDTRTDVPVTTSENNYFTKFTYLVNSQHTLNVSYVYDHRDLLNQQTGGDSAGDHGYDDQRRGWFVVGNLTSLLGNNTVNEMRISWSHQGLFRRLPAGTAPKPELSFPTVEFGEAGNVPQGRTQDNRIFSDALSHHFVAKGSHDLRVGFEANIVPTTSLINQSLNGHFEFLADAPVIPGDPSTLPYRFTQAIALHGRGTGDNTVAMNRNIDIYSTFINDEWRPKSNVTINLGLRYDWQRWRGDLNGQDVPKNMSKEQFWVEQVQGSLVGQNFKPAPNDINNFGPRLGITWDPKGDARTVVRGGYGIYYDQIQTTTLMGIVDRYPGFITTEIANDARASGVPNSFFPNLPTQSLPESVGSSFQVASPTAEAPFTHQMTAGFTRQLSSDYAFSVDYVYMRGEHFPLTVNVNARRADGTFPLIDSGVRMLLYDDVSPMRIHQAQFRLNKRFSGRLGFLLGYTLGSARTIANDGTPSDNYDLMADWGPTNNDVRHRFVGNVTYQAPLGILLGGIVTATSTVPYNITLGQDVNKDGSNNDRPAGTAFNAGRGDGFFDTDLRISKRFGLGHANAEIMWEMFNLFNTVNFNNYQGNMRSKPGFTATGIPTGFGQPRQAFDAFEGQLGLKITF